MRFRRRGSARRSHLCGGCGRGGGESGSVGGREVVVEAGAGAGAGVVVVVVVAVAVAVAVVVVVVVAVNPKPFVPCPSQVSQSPREEGRQEYGFAAWACQSVMWLAARQTLAEAVPWPPRVPEPELAVLHVRPFWHLILEVLASMDTLPEEGLYLDDAEEYACANHQKFQQPRTRRKLRRQKAILEGAAAAAPPGLAAEAVKGMWVLDEDYEESPFKEVDVSPTGQCGRQR